MSLTYKYLLDNNQEGMINHIIATTPVDRDKAELMVTQLWDRLISRLMKEHNLSQNKAERIMNEALGFLRICAIEPGMFGPSEEVDLGWHMFILYTPEYAAFCHIMCGHYIHHIPDDVVSLNSQGVTLARTVSIMQAHGVADLELWPMMTSCAGKCGGSNCGGGGRCSGGQRCKTIASRCTSGDCDKVFAAAPACNGGKCDHSGGCEGLLAS